MPDVAGAAEINELKSEIKTELNDLKHDLSKNEETGKWETRLAGLETKLAELTQLHQQHQADRETHRAAVAGLEKSIQEIRSMISDLNAKHLVEEAEIETPAEEVETLPPVEIVEVPQPVVEEKEKGLHWI